MDRSFHNSFTSKLGSNTSFAIVSGSKPPLPRRGSVQLNSTRFKGPNGSIFEDSRDAEEFQRSAISSIVNRIKNSSERSNSAPHKLSTPSIAPTLSDNKNTSDAKEPEQAQYQQQMRQEQTQKQLEELKTQLDLLSDQFDAPANPNVSQDSKKLHEFKQKHEKDWMRMQSKLKEEKRRKQLLSQIGKNEQTELDNLKSQYLDILKDLHRAENIKDYLTTRKRELFMLKKFHQSDRGTMAAQNFKLEKLFLENRALRQKELQRVRLAPEDACEDVVLEGQAFQLSKQIGRMRQENAKLKLHLSELTMK
ncbi:uncharacterized protein LOC142342822 isoform X1 [Convolutriloba macropyga]|uniref:uncharacterized protein LOC142342822 isoform X1 n=1 Tax=Convolutriloba macropyga TaxID=536237 RepID=UPI003F51AF4D